MSEALENAPDSKPAGLPPETAHDAGATNESAATAQDIIGAGPLRLCADTGDSPEDPIDTEDDATPVAAEADKAAGDDDTKADGSDIEAGSSEDDEGAADAPCSERPVAEVSTEQIVEAILFGADVALTPAKIVSILGVGSARDVRSHIERLNARYAQTGASFRIEKIAGGYQMLTLPEMNPWLKRLKANRQESKLSQAALETLAVVAYRQPVTRAVIESIRGVATGEMLNRLRELGLVKIVGRAEDVGRPLLYGTTKRFLEVFGLGSLEDLPTVEELKAPD